LFEVVFLTKTKTIKNNTILLFGMEFNSIIDKLDLSLGDMGNYVQFNSKNYSPVRIDKANFKPIGDAVSGSKIVFIDGGNAEILKASNFSLQFIRVYYTVYKKNRRIESEKKEFFVLTNAKRNGENISFSTSVFDSNFRNLSFDSFDETIRQGNNRASVSVVGNIVRRFAEIDMAKSVVDGLEQGDIIVLDGDLKARYTFEAERLDGLYKKASEKGISVAAISKTCDMFTDSGNSFLGVLSRMSPDGCWCYFPIVNVGDGGHKVDMFVVRLHPKAKYFFKVEVCKDTSCDKDVFFGLLRANSEDPVFLGYPYGLVESDKFARVGNNEKEAMKLQIMAKAGKKWQHIDHYLSTMNAHDVLDNVG